MKIKAYLQMTRAHTFPATFVLIMVGYLVGGGNLFSWFGLSLVILAWLIHTQSFGDNSLIDFLTGWDKADPHKKHFPLSKGTISPKTATNLIQPGIFLTTLFALAMTFWSGGNQLLALVWLVVFITAGNWYNKNFSKTSIFAFFPISLCWASLGLWAFFLASPALSELGVLMAIYVFALEWFENGVEGSTKELETKEVNMLKTLGARLGGFMVSPKQGGRLCFSPGPARYYGWAIKLAGLGTGLIILLNYSLSAVPVVLYLLLASLAVYFCNEITKYQRWDRNRMLRNFAVEEILSIYLLPCILLPVIGYLEGTMLMMSGILYFAIFNRINWGTWLRPQV